VSREVGIGTCAAAVVTIQNASGIFTEQLVVESVAAVPGDGDFLIPMAPPPYTVLQIGESAPVEALFSPSVAGLASVRSR
jgi:hypothetical protein